VAAMKVYLHKYNFVIINSLYREVREEGEWGWSVGGVRKTRILDLLRQDFIKV
jgi:hypothetical protein